CSNEANGRGLRADHRGCAENGLFALLPQEHPGDASGISLNVLMWRYRDKDIQRKSHIRIIGASAALGRNPSDILVGILDVAGFAVDAILRVDHEFWRVPFLNPLVDARRTVSRGGAGENVMLGFFL